MDQMCKLQSFVNFSRMSPKLMQTYPHIVENWGITIAPIIFEINIMKKSYPCRFKKGLNIFKYLKKNSGSSFFRFST